MKIKRNDKCPCDSGKKFKKCCMNTESGKILLNAKGKWFKEFIASRMAKGKHLKNRKGDK